MRGFPPNSRRSTSNWIKALRGIREAIYDPGRQQCQFLKRGVLVKSLVITHKYPLPENSGERLRTMNFVRYLGRSGRVDTLYFHRADEGVGPSFPYGEQFFVDKYQGGYGSKLSQLLEKLKYLKPWLVCGYTRECVAEVVRIIERESYDVILCRYAHHAYPLFFLPEQLRGRIIVDIDDLIGEELYQTIHGKGASLLRVKSLLDFRLSQLHQVRCAALGRSLVCSEVDRQRLERRVDAQRLFLVPNIAPPVSLPEGYRRDGHPNLAKILFVGTLEYAPNVQGLEWFVAEIFSRLAALDPSVTLTIVGRNPTASVRALCDCHERVYLVGNPPDLVPFYQECGVVVVPVLNGGGTRIKILEAGSLLRPVISTPAGAHGLSVVEHEQLLYMRDYPSFIEAYRTLGNRGHYRRMVTGLNDFVASHYSVDSFNRSMDLVTDQRASRGGA